MIYFDNNATTRVMPEVFEAMRPFLDGSFGNPSSAHSAGREASAAVERARTSLARLLGANSAAEIVFTSGGTESDNWAIMGALEAAEGQHIVTTTVEHEAVRKLCGQLEARGKRVTWLGVDREGRLDPDELIAALQPETAVVSAMLANNETGVLFPVEEIGRIVKEHSNALFHVDGVNAVGKVPIDLKLTEIDLFSLSAHKFHGPKGIGALYIREGTRLPSAAIGGSQEGGRRAGTPAVHQIAGLGAAAEFVEDLSPMSEVGRLRDRLEAEVLRRVADTAVNGARKGRVPNTTNISFENTNGEMIMALLDAEGICVSTGSACHSSDKAPSAVLSAMEVPYSRAMGSIRFSLGRTNTEAEVDQVVDVLERVVARLRSMAV